MSTPAATPATPDAYGKRQPETTAPVVDIESSANCMNNLSKASEEDCAEARKRNDRNLDDALGRLELQYGIEKARLLAQHAGLETQLRELQETIAVRKAEVVKAMDVFLDVTKTASIAAVDLIPVAIRTPTTPPRQIEDIVSQQRPQKFLNHDPEPTRRPVTQLRPSIIPLVLLAIALTAMIGVAGVSIARSQDRGMAAPHAPQGADGSSRSLSVTIQPPVAGGINPEGYSEPIRLDRRGRVLASCEAAQ